MLQKTLLFALLHMMIFSKLCNSKDASMDIAGLTAKVNRRGLDFLTEQINTFAEEFLLTVTLPDFDIPMASSTVAHVENLKVNDLNLGNVGLTTAPPNEVTVELGRSSLIADGSFTLESPALNSFGSNISVSIDDVYLEFRVVLGRHKFTNLLKFTTNVCNASVGLVEFDFNGDPALVSRLEAGLTAYRQNPENNIENLIEGKICSLIQSFIAKALNNLMGNYSDTFDLPLSTSIDLKLTQDPVATSNSFQISARGTCFPTGNPKFPIYFDPVALPPLKVTSKMVQGAISEYVLNTYSHSIFSQNYLKFMVDVKKAISLVNSVLPDLLHFDVASLTESCIDAPPAQGIRLPYSFEFLTDSAPLLKINDGSFSIFARYKALLHYATSADASNNVVALDANYGISGNIYASENIIGLDIYCVHLQVEETCFSSNVIRIIKNYSVGIVNKLISNLRPNGIIGDLNEITVPIFLGYTPDNIEIILKKGAMEFASDIVLDE